MARVIDDLEHDGRQGRYPWVEWLDGRAWELTRGEDFTTTPQTLRQQVYYQAARRGKAATVRIAGDTLRIQARELR